MTNKFRHSILVLLSLATIDCFAGPPVMVKFIPRTPDQIGSFYEGRGFPKPMIDFLREQCFITTMIHNVSDDIVWLEMPNWSFTADGERLIKKSREEWKSYWNERDIPLSSQSTFHWTQIPDVLDFLPNEKEGGNIILPKTDKPITIHASFATRADKNGPHYEITFDNIRCAEDKR